MKSGKLSPQQAHNLCGHLVQRSYPAPDQNRGKAYDKTCTYQWQEDFGVPKAGGELSKADKNGWTQ